MKEGNVKEVVDNLISRDVKFCRLKTMNISQSKKKKKCLEKSDLHIIII